MKVQLDTKKLLGYRAVAGYTALDGKLGVKGAGKTGSKGGGGRPSIKLGAKMGAKMGAKAGAKGGGRSV